MSQQSDSSPPEPSDSSGVDPFDSLSNAERARLVEVRELALRGNHRDARTKLDAMLADESLSDASKTVAASLHSDLGPDRVAVVVAAVAIGIVILVFVMVT